MLKLDHPNIIKMYDYSDKQKLISADKSEQDVFYMALELARGGELFDFVAQTGRFSEEIARYYFLQLLDALEYIHTKGISHCDIKLENVMLDEDYNLKLADFGFSSNKSVNETVKGTSNYMAPEIELAKRYHGPVVDLFAAGIILFIMVTEEPPFIKAAVNDMYYKTIVANRVDMFWKIHAKKKAGGMDFFNSSFIDLINAMFAFESIERASLAEIRSHEWCQGPVATKEEILSEFTKRKEILESEALDNDDPIPDHSPESKLFGSKEMRGVGEESKDDIVREVQEYIAGFTKYTEFFSTSHPDDLLNSLVTFAEKLTTDFDVSSSEYSLSMKIVQKTEELELTVNILKVPDEEKYCVEVLHNTGNRLWFNKVYKNLKGFFAGHNNAVL